MPTVYHLTVVAMALRSPQLYKKEDYERKRIAIGQRTRSARKRRLPRLCPDEVMAAASPTPGGMAVAQLEYPARQWALPLEQCASVETGLVEGPVDQLPVRTKISEWVGHGA